MTAFLKKKANAPLDMSRIEMDGLTPDEIKAADSVANVQKLQQIEASWPTGSQPLSRPGRLFVHESMLTKMCRKGLKGRYFWLFNDILIYGTPITKTKFSSQVVMKLNEISVQSVEDSAEGSNGLQINDKRKSFLVYCASANEKTYWLRTLKRFIRLSREMVGLDGENELVDSRAVWVPDIKVKVCMVCNVAAFSMRNRKHHCRNCGKVVCGPCSAFKAVLNQQKPERVCRVCHDKLGGSDPADIPVLGAASTENAAQKYKERHGDNQGISSDDYSSSEDDDEDRGMGELPVDESVKEAAKEVLDGKTSIDDAVARVAAKDWVESQENGEMANASEWSVPDGPHAIALYDNDDPEHPDEISFMTKDVLCLTKRLDAEWLEGYLHGVEPKKVGIFPAAFVEIKIAP